MRLTQLITLSSVVFSGANAAHDTGRSARSTQAGWEGIFANYSLLFLGEAVRGASKKRKLQKMGGQGFLNQLLAGSLIGQTTTAMVTCLSPSVRNGAESLLSCKYSQEMSLMKNNPRQQPNIHFDELVRKAEVELECSSKIVKKGVVGKYQAKRVAEVVGCETTLRILLEELGSGDDTTCKTSTQGRKK